ncbi:amino acid deaminase [Agreia pratensis]|uniref:amino acid deaminase n=1 Tax=Agreia pratensis TaxID=150121 RepID=UPI00188BD609|nr:amino acid deaminase [Agreia pratensis]MBF4635572.1 amino acid deaminase [Agreia pratensis]
MTIDDLLGAATRIDAGESPRSVLEGSLLAAQIAQDASADRFSLWGLSTVVDENTGTPVISPALFAELHRLAGLDATWPVGNAGLIHVYGYLLSTVSTPYGLKRDRWVNGDVARALGLEPSALTPWHEPASATTPLHRLAVALSSIFDAPAEAPGVVFVMRESSDRISAMTVLVRRPSSEHSALLYAVDGKLVTAFSFEISSSSIEALRAEPPRLRYNAVVDAPKQPLDSRRVLLDATSDPE